MNRRSSRSPVLLLLLLPLLLLILPLRPLYAATVTATTKGSSSRIEHPRNVRASSQEGEEGTEGEAVVYAALVEARTHLFQGQWSRVVDATAPHCRHWLVTHEEQQRAAVQQPLSSSSSILAVACLNLLGLGLSMMGGRANARRDDQQEEGDVEQQGRAAFLQAFQLIDERHHLPSSASSSSSSPSSPPLHYDLVELEVMKNLQWSLQCVDEEGPMLAVREALSRSIIQSNGLLPYEPLARHLSTSFSDLGINAKVCQGHGNKKGKKKKSSRHQPHQPGGSSSSSGGGGAEEEELLYLDLVKRGVTYYLHSDMPHQAMPMGTNGGWDIFYRMRDFQTVPPRNGQRFEDGFTTKEVGVLDLIHEAALSVMREGVEGDWLEAGVWRGGTSILLAAISKVYKAGRRVILADSFAGIPSSSLSNWDERYAVPIDTVKDNFRRFGLLDEDEEEEEDLDDEKNEPEGDSSSSSSQHNQTTSTTSSSGTTTTTLSGRSPPAVVFVEGFFSSSLPHLLASPPSSPPLRLSLLLADADAYQSTLDILEHLYPVLSVGGYVVVDDFHIPECRQAILHYRRVRAITEPMMPAPTDYAYGCKACGDDGSRLPPAEEGGMLASWPHAMWWRRSIPEYQLRAYTPPPPVAAAGASVLES